MCKALMIVITYIMSKENHIVQITLMVDNTFILTHTCTCNC